MRFVLTSVVLAAALVLTGCSADDRVRPESIDVPQNTPLDQAKRLLENYAKGQQVGSEATSFDTLITDVRKTDAPRADILQKGFADLQKTKGTATAAKAKEVLRHLEPKMKGD